MLPSRRKGFSSKNLKSNSAKAIALLVILLATVLIVPQSNLYSGLLPRAAFGQDWVQQEMDKDQTTDQEQDDSSTTDQEQDDSSTTDQEQDDSSTTDQEQDDSSTTDRMQRDSTETFTAEIVSNSTEGTAPATFGFVANATGGNGP
jgi:hypothetical protein